MKLKNCKLIEPFKCNANDSIEKVAKKFSTTSLRHIFVVDKDAPVGVISVIDIVMRVVAEDKKPSVVKAKDIMTKNIESYDVDDDVFDVYKKMQSKNRAMCAVTKGGAFVGIITLHELFVRITHAPESERK